MENMEIDYENMTPLVNVLLLTPIHRWGFYSARNNYYESRQNNCREQKTLTFLATFWSHFPRESMGNPLNWDEIVEDLGPRLFRYFCARFSREQADDLTQETLIRLVGKIESGKFDPKKGTLKMLGFGIAHYVALESRPLGGHDSIENWQDSLGVDDDLEQVTIAKDAALKVKEMTKSLSAVEQQVLALLVDEELSLNEISLILGAPLGTIKSHIFRAKKKLASLIQKESVV